MKTVVYLVDNNKRDLAGVVLLSNHLEKLGVKCMIEPLEAWKASLWTHKPDMIIFNHLLGSHLVEYSNYLHSIGVLVAVLPNEGILYNQEVLDFNSSKFHNGAHIDYFFVWNEAHQNAIVKGLNDTKMKVEIIGVPRFDFYFPPFVENKKDIKTKTLLICTNFVFSQFAKKDKSVADKLFSPWKGRISSYEDYWELINTNAKSKEMFFEFLNKIVSINKYNIILKPHPGEDKIDYDKWYDSLDYTLKQRITYDKDSYIWELIPKCDLEIACETCTTTLESWIAGKKTIELEFTKHPVFYHKFISDMGPVCDKTNNIIDKIDNVLDNDIDKKEQILRDGHLSKWCDSPDGKSTLKLAKIIANAVVDTKPNYFNIPFSYKRKAMKAKLLNLLGLAYNYDPLLGIKNMFNHNKYKDKVRVYNKTVKPEDINIWKDKIEQTLHGCNIVK